MRWWLGVALNVTYFAAIWVISSKYLTQSQQFRFQLFTIPLMFFFNWLYGMGVSTAYSQGVPLFYVSIFTTVLSVTLSTLGGWLVLHQAVSWRQAVGMLVVIVGVALLNWKK